MRRHARLSSLWVSRRSLIHHCDLWHALKQGDLIRHIDADRVHRKYAVLRGPSTLIHDPTAPENPGLQARTLTSHRMTLHVLRQPRKLSFVLKELPSPIRKGRFIIVERTFWRALSAAPFVWLRAGDKKNQRSPRRKKPPR